MKRGLSKSKLLSARQCAKRIWLEAHRPELIPEDAARERAFEFGHQVGEMARRLMPGGILVSHENDLQAALAETRDRLLAGGKSILFEAAIQHDGVLVRTDILEVMGDRVRIREVKATGSVKDHHLSDAAIQAWVLASAGLKVEAVSIQHVDTGFVYPGDDDYGGLFVEVPVTGDIQPLLAQVPLWIDEARRVLVGDEPNVEMGTQCTDPYPCPFFDHCSSLVPKVELPLALLPFAGKTIPRLVSEGFNSLRDIPEGRLTSEFQERVRRAHVTGEPFLDPAVARLMGEFGYPRTFFDFETVGFAVPIWKGTRPYQQVPFQWSMHVEGPRRTVNHHEFLDLSGKLPALELVNALVAAIPDDGPVFAYNAGFESRALELLGEMLPGRAKALQRIRERLVDLYPITRKHYYHPGMSGSWSLKAVMPTIPGGPDYELLDEVKEGSAAQEAYFEAIGTETSAERRKELEKALLRYCSQDTESLLILSRFLEGRGR